MLIQEPVWPNRPPDYYLTTLKDPNIRVRCQAAAALEVLGEVTAIAPLIGMLMNDQEEEARVNAARALGKLGGNQAVQALIQVLPDPSRKICSTAAWSLKRIGDKQAVPALCAILYRDDCYYEIIYSLKDFGDERAIEPLNQVVQDPSRPQYLRDLANWALAYLSPSQVQEPFNDEV